MKLTIISEPNNCEIFVDGKSTGKYTPGQLKLKPGKHSIQVKREGYLPSDEKLYSVEYNIFERSEDPEDRLNFTLSKN
jgi:hypothetical protein